MLRIIFLTLFFLANISPAMSATKGENAFNSGIKYFKKNKYKSALYQFKKAHSYGMKNDSLMYNLGVTYYKLGDDKNSKKYFNLLTKNKKFRQVAYYNLGLIAEKSKDKKAAIKYYKKSVKIANSRISTLANSRLDILLKRKNSEKNINTYLNVALGSDDNISNATSNSPSNKSSTYLEIFASVKSPINNKMDLKGSVFSINYNNNPSENYMFYSAAVNYKVKTNGWKVIPEVAFLKSNYNKSDFQNILDLKLIGKKTLNNKNRLSLRYRFSDIRSQNTLYNYLQGNRHQFRVDYKTKIQLGWVRWRYQIEANDRKNSALSNYSPTRHTLRMRLKQKLDDLNFTEEIGYRISQYGEASGISRNDKRLRLNVSMSKHLSRDLLSGIQYHHTNNSSNVSGENYSRNNFQVFIRLDF